MAKISVAYRSAAAEFGIASAVSAGPGAWNNPSRLGDYFAHETADSVSTPTGLTEIKIDQGTVVSNYVSPDVLIFAPRHNVTVVVTLEFNSADSWAGGQTAVTLTDVLTVAALKVRVMTFPKVFGVAGNRWWRISFTKTDAKVEIAEAWLSELVELGEAETDPAEVSRGNAGQPAAFPILPNIRETITEGGVWSGVELGDERRGFSLDGRRMTDAAYQDWKDWRTKSRAGLRPIFFKDPIGEYWFARSRPGQRTIRQDDVIRWDVSEDLEEIL